LVSIYRPLHELLSVSDPGDWLNWVEQSVTIMTFCSYVSAFSYLCIRLP
jgi:hypothetical protein